MENYDDCHRTYYDSGQINYKWYTLKNRYHRIDGPAIVKCCESGKIQYENYMLNGQFHRLDGPAIVGYEDGQIKIESYWFNGISVNNIVEYITELRKSENKMKVLTKILSEHFENKKAVATILVNMFKNDISPTVLDNLEMFL